MDKLDFRIATLGETTVDSPIQFSKLHEGSIANYVSDKERVIYTVDTVCDSPPRQFDQCELMEKRAQGKRFISNLLMCTPPLLPVAVSAPGSTTSSGP